MARNAAARETVFALRHKIAKIEGRLAERLETPAADDACPAENPTGDATTDATIQPTLQTLIRRDGRPADILLPTGASGLDRALGGGLPLAALTEIHGAETRNCGAIAGFTLSLASRLLKAASDKVGPVLWIGTHEALHEAGFPYAAGIETFFGIAPQSLLFCATSKLNNALWVAEEAIRLAGFSAVILEIRGALPSALLATRRLHMRAREAGRPVFLLRHAGPVEPTAAPLRMSVAPAPSALRNTLAGPLKSSIGRPAFTVAIDKSPAARPGRFILEWNADECAFTDRETPEIRAKIPLSVVPLPGDGTHPAPASGTVLAFPPDQPFTSGRQPARGQRPAHRGSRRTG